MGLYAISDVHLSFGVKNKTMNIFKGWHNHAERLRENWNAIVKEDDVTVIGGDISWGMSLEEALEDFRFIDKELNGTKLILKGNHDYWWKTLSKMRRFLAENDITTIDFLHNNSYFVHGCALCGTRGWICEDSNATVSDLSELDAKTLKKEAVRLETSVMEAVETVENSQNSDNKTEIIAFLHYPPIYSYFENQSILDVLRKYSIKRVFSGHIHSGGFDSAFMGERYGIHFDMITADSLNFTPKKII